MPPAAPLPLVVVSLEAPIVLPLPVEPEPEAPEPAVLPEPVLPAPVLPAPVLPVVPPAVLPVEGLAPIVELLPEVPPPLALGVLLEAPPALGVLLEAPLALGVLEPEAPIVEPEDEEPAPVDGVPVAVPPAALCAVCALSVRLDEPAAPEAPPEPEACATAMPLTARPAQVNRMLRPFFIERTPKKRG